jgi:hypothetical protein
MAVSRDSIQSFPYLISKGQRKVSYRILYKTYSSEMNFSVFNAKFNAKQQQPGPKP